MSSPILILLVAAQCAALQLRPGCAITAGLSTAAPLPPLMLAKKGKKKGGKDPSRPPRAAPAPAARSASSVVEKRTAPAIVWRWMKSLASGAFSIGSAARAGTSMK